MFAPKVAKPQNNVVESPISKLTGQRSALGGHRLGHDPVEPALALQRRIGNRATLRFLAHQAPRPAGCAPADEQAVNPNQSHEQAAQRTAEHVLHMSASAEDCDAASGAQRLDPPAGSDLVPTAGEPLDAATRAFMEPRFGYNFANVRVHAGPDAASSARKLAANAYTVGPHIVFAANRFVPGTQAGRRLLAHELAHVVQQAQGVSPPMVQRDEAAAAEPWAKLSTAAARDAQAVWDDCDDSMDLLTEAQMVRQGATRSRWLNTLRAHRAAIEASDSDAKLTAAKTAYRAFDRQLNSEMATYQKEWAELANRYSDEHDWLLSRSVKSTDSIEAADYLEGVYRATAPIPIWVADDDYMELKYVLDKQEYIRVGALRGARKRATQLFQIMHTVADLRRRGEDAEKFIPEWSIRVTEEAKYLESFAALARGAGRDYAAELTDLRKRLLAEQQDTMKVRESTTALDKGVALVTGAVENVAGIFVEAAKQAVDLAQINLHILTLGEYDPTFISDTAKAAEQGATTTDLLKGMITGMIDTPSRFLKACRDGDWEAIGRESVNLYFLAKTIKAAPELIKGSAEALRRLPDALARTRASLTILRQRTVALGLKAEGRFTPEPQIRVAPLATPTPGPGTPPRLVEGQGRGQVSGTPPTGVLRDVDSPSRSVQVDASHTLLKKGNGPANVNDPPPPPPRSQAQKVSINAPEDFPHARSIDTTHSGQPRSSQRRDQPTTAMAGKPPSGDKLKAGAPKTSSGMKAGVQEKAMLTEQDVARLRQLAEWEKRGRITGDVHGLRTRLNSNDPDTLRAAQEEFDDASVDIAEGKRPHVEHDAEDPRPKIERISTGGKKRIDFNGWIKKRLPNGNDQWDYRDWLKTSHKVGSIEHDHPAPGTNAAEALVVMWEEEMGRRR